MENCKIRKERTQSQILQQSLWVTDSHNNSNDMLLNKASIPDKRVRDLLYESSEHIFSHLKKKCVLFRNFLRKYCQIWVIALWITWKVESSMELNSQERVKELEKNAFCLQ